MISQMILYDNFTDVKNFIKKSYRASKLEKTIKYNSSFGQWKNSCYSLKDAIYIYNSIFLKI